jgi:hypothetical protein
LLRWLAPQVAPARAPGNTPENAPSAAPAVAPSPAAEPALKRSVFELHPFEAKEMRDVTLMAVEFCGRSRSPGVLRLSPGPKLPEERPVAAEHAYMLLQWLMTRPDGPGRFVPAHDLKRAYSAYCRDNGLKAQPWQTVARYINYFTGSIREYRRIGGRNVRVYWIPERTWLFEG